MPPTKRSARYARERAETRRGCVEPVAVYYRFARICTYLLTPSSLRVSGRDEIPPHIPR